MWIAVFIIIVIIVVIALFIWATYNALIGINNGVKEAFSTMDVYLKKRWDLVPNLVETVKGYAKHEKESFEEVTRIRSNAYDSMSDDEKIKANQELGANISKLMLLAEAYPELKASQNFLDLSGQLARVEEDIANARKYYNALVRNFNNRVEMFPSNVVAGMFGFHSKTMFEVNEAERENVKVSF